MARIWGLFDSIKSVKMPFFTFALRPLMFQDQIENWSVGREALAVSEMTAAFSLLGVTSLLTWRLDRKLRTGGLGLILVEVDLADFLSFLTFLATVLTVLTAFLVTRDTG